MKAGCNGIGNLEAVNLLLFYFSKLHNSWSRAVETVRSNIPDNNSFHVLLRQQPVKPLSISRVIAVQADIGN